MSRAQGISSRTDRWTVSNHGGRQPLGESRLGLRTSSFGTTSVPTVCPVSHRWVSGTTIGTPSGYPRRRPTLSDPCGERTSEPREGGVRPGPVDHPSRSRDLEGPDRGKDRRQGPVTHSTPVREEGDRAKGHPPALFPEQVPGGTTTSRALIKFLG